MSHVLTFIAHGALFAPGDEAAIEKYVVEDLRATAPQKTVLSKHRVVEYAFDPESPQTIAALVRDAIQRHPPAYDVIFQPVAGRRHKKLFIFDMDSTLIYQEVIELIAAYANIEPRVAEITERAMNGELDFNASLAERVALLKGIDATTLWEELKTKIRVTKGAVELARALKRLGVTMGVLSGGFIPLAEHVKSLLGLDYAYANTLGVSDNKLDGTTVGPIVNGERKAALLLEIANKHSIDPKTAVAVGDGANDLPMMEVAGWGVAWNAKPKVQKQAPSCLNTDSLLDVLYILGYSDAEITKLVQV